MQRGEIWWVKFDSVGSEIQKTRPAVIVDENWVQRVSVRIVVPITEWKPVHEPLSWVIKLKPNPGNGLRKPSAADPSQLKSVSTVRLQGRIGVVTVEELDEIVAGIVMILGHQCPNPNTTS